MNYIRNLYINCIIGSVLGTTEKSLKTMTQKRILHKNKKITLTIFFRKLSMKISAFS